jgi:hypothetical protein
MTSNDGDCMQTPETTIPMTEGGGFSGALSIDQFCQRYGIGRSSAYAEIREGNLPLRKCRGRSLILIGDAERWAASLPLANR